MCVSWDTARLPTPGGCSHTNTLPHTAPGTAGAQHWHGRTQCTRHARHCPPLPLPGEGLPAASPEWAGAGQELSPGLGREQWVSCLRHGELSSACTARVGLGCAGFCCAVVFHRKLRELSQTKCISSKGPVVFFACEAHTSACTSSSAVPHRHSCQHSLLLCSQACPEHCQIGTAGG